MEFKKNPRVDIHRRSTLYFNIGLVIALFMVNTAFEWTTFNDVSRVDLEVNQADINNFEAVKVVVKEVAPPKPQLKPENNAAKKKSLAEEMEELEFEVDITVDLEFP